MKKIYFILIFFSFLVFSQHQKKLEDQYEFHFGQLRKSKENNDEKAVRWHCTQALALAKKMKESALEGKVYVATGNYFYEQSDTSIEAYDNYQKAYASYTKARDTLKIAKTIFRMAILEKNIRNYSRAKESLFRALELIGNEKPDFLGDLYNDLGIVYDHLGDLKKSIFYYKKALVLRYQAKDKELIIQTLNNLATTSKDHRDYESSEKYFSQVFRYPPQELENYPEEYARLIDNRAHLHFLKKATENILAEYLQALEIRKKEGKISDIVMSELHLAEYYQLQHQYLLSKNYAKQAYRKSYANQDFRGALMALIILRNNAQETKNYYEASQYGEQYNRLLTQMHQEEMSVEEKFADIRYAASQKEKENKNLRLQNKEQQLLTEKRKKYLYISIGLFGVIILAGTGYIQYSRMEQKQKEQNAEKEIISLLLERQEAAEKAKHLEQERISNDLHDSIAGKLSGLMLKLDTIAVSSPEEIKKKLSPAVENVDAILQELTSIVRNMNQQQIISTTYPLLIKETAVGQLADRVSLKFRVDSAIDWDTIPNQIKLAFYYIIQQGVRNITEHSQATEAQVEIQLKENKVYLIISDNGVGMKHTDHKGIGISGMRKRTEELRGTFEIRSENNKGTQLYLKIPLL